MSTATDRAPARRPEADAAKQARRALARYLLLPRPGDAAKLVIIPAAYVVGALAASSVSGPAVARALVVWLAIEYLVYQARYQWNDINGYRADQMHPGRASRARLPGPPERARRNVRISAAVAALRLGLALALPLALSGLRAGPILIGSSISVLLVASLYESLRRWGTGQSDADQPPGRCAVALWVVIGMGYAVRGLTGLALAIDLTSHLLVAVTAAAAFWASGSAFVTSRWALESLAFASVLDDRRVRWHATASQAREHILSLAHWLPPRGPSSGELPTWCALAAGSPLTAPWNVAGAIGITIGTGLGAELSHLDGAPMPAAAPTALMATALLAGVVLMRVPRAFVAAAATASVLAVGTLTGLDRPWLAALPIAMLGSVHVISMRQCLADIGSLRHRLGRAAKRGEQADPDSGRARGSRP